MLNYQFRLTYSANELISTLTFKSPWSKEVKSSSLRFEPSYCVSLNIYQNYSSLHKSNFYYYIIKWIMFPLLLEVQKKINKKCLNYSLL